MKRPACRRRNNFLQDSLSKVGDKRSRSYGGSDITRHLLYKILNFEYHEHTECQKFDGCLYELPYRALAPTITGVSAGFHIISSEIHTSDDIDELVSDGGLATAVVLHLKG